MLGTNRIRKAVTVMTAVAVWCVYSMVATRRTRGHHRRNNGYRSGHSKWPGRGLKLDDHLGRHGHHCQRLKCRGQLR